MNGSKSTDFYSTYTGVTMADLLDDAGMLSSATQINVVSPDGFSQYFPLDPGTSTVAGMYPVRYTYPDEFYYYNSQADTATNPTGGWCNYSSPGCAGLLAGSPIVTPDGEKMLVAWARDGSRLDTGTLDVTNKLNGEGPFRVVPPQLKNGAPDIGSNVTTTAAIVWPYSSSNDHNSGYSPRTATMIKVGPMPAGTTDINTLEAGWPYVDSDSIVVYGDIDPVPTVRSNVAALAAYVLALPGSDWAKPGQGTALAAQISALDGPLSADGFEGVISKIESNLLLKSDGVVLRGVPDRDDWVTDTTAQRKVYWGLRGIVTLLRSNDPVDTSISISSSKAGVTRGAAFTLSGVLRPGSVGDSVVVDVSKPGSSRWSYLTTRLAGSTSGPAGAVWSCKTALNSRGTFSFRAQFDGTAYRNASVSRTVRVTAR